MKKAAAKDISVPYAEGAYYLIKTLEEKNDGKFDYSERRNLMTAVRSRMLI